MFVAANVLIGAVMLLLSFSLQGHPGERMARDLLSVQGRAIVALLDAGRHADAREVLVRLYADAHIDAYVLDEHGAEALGRPLPESLRQVVEDARAGRPPPSAMPFGVVRVAAPVSVDGRQWTVAAILDMPPLPPGAGRPEIFVPRALLAASAAALVCYAFAAYLVEPVRRLRSAAERIAKGDLRARAGPSVGRRRDEIGQLAQRFDKMADHIEALVADQQQLFRHASHELRSPLARLQVAVGTLRQRFDDPLFDRVEAEAERLNRLIDQFLTLARLESPARPAQRTPVDLARLTAEVAADADFEARARGGEVVAAIDAAVTVMGDEEALRAAVENVVRNAVVHAAGGGRVELSLAVAASGAPPAAPRRESPPPARRAVLQVRDHGPGVPAEQLASIFTPFSSPRDGRVGGLGLTIAKRCVEMHAGAIRIVNHAAGGLLITIELPI